MAEPDMETSTLNKVINEEYKLWRKNVSFLYDIMIAHSLDWPTLTVQWLPDRESHPDKDYDIHRVLIGTHTSGAENNYVHIAQVNVPRAGSTSAKDDNTRFDQERGEMGAFTDVGQRFKIYQSIPHDGEVNRARYMPQNSNLIATKSVNGDVYVFDRTKHVLEPADNAAFKPDITLRGHEKEGYGIEWNPTKQRSGHLISTSDDETICHWDVSGWTKSNSTLDPLTRFTGHTGVVEDASWHATQPDIFASVGDDRHLMLWDMRVGTTPTASKEAHDAEVNAVAFSPHTETLLVTASTDKTIGLWDIRQIKSKLHSFTSHTEEVTQLSWSPHVPTVFASASADRRVHVHDLSRIGLEQTPEEAEEGGPELTMVHGGHTSRITDLSWNPHLPWTLSTAAEDNIIQFWRPAQAIWAAQDVPVDPIELE